MQVRQRGSERGGEIESETETETETEAEAGVIERERG